MRRVIFGLAAAMLVLAASEASACCHKAKKACAPAPVCAPVCEPAPCAPKKKCCFKLPKMKLGCHKKAKCEPTCAPAPCGQAVVWAAPQAMAAPQAAATGQTPVVPSK